jgi:hypothetical protein
MRMFVLVGENGGAFIWIYTGGTAAMFLKKRLERPWRLPSTVKLKVLCVPGISTCN